MASEENAVNGDADHAAWRVKIHDANKDGEIVRYHIETFTDSHEDEGLEDIKENGTSGIKVTREYEDFEFLYHNLIASNNVEGIVIPPLPPKPAASASATEAKSKKQLGGQFKSMMGDQFNKDCRGLEKFLQLVLKHPAFSGDKHIETFLIEQQAPARVKVKKSLLGNLTKAVDEVRFQSHKDIDEDFQKHRDFTSAFLAALKDSYSAYEAMVNVQQRLALAVGDLGITLQVMNGVDTASTKRLNSLTGKFADCLDQSKNSYDVMCANDENTLGFTMELYTRYMENAKNMLLKRTVKLVEFENATKALEKAKPKNLVQLENNKEEAEKAYEDITEAAKSEMSSFQRQRVMAFQSSLVQHVESRISNGRDTLAVLTKLQSDLKKMI